MCIKCDEVQNDYPNRNEFGYKLDKFQVFENHVTKTKKLLISQIIKRYLTILFYMKFQ